MKTFVILSDSHGRSRKRLEKLAPLFAENDYVVHLGDGASDMRPVLSECPEKTYVCVGNCDWTYGGEEHVVEAEGLSVLCCHGHRYGVKHGRERLAAAAKAKGCEIALYGHTHEAAIEEIDGVLCVNPGALCDAVEPSYCYLVLNKGKAVPTIVRLDP